MRIRLVDYAILTLRYDAFSCILKIRNMSSFGPLTEIQDCPASQVRISYQMNSLISSEEMQ